MKCKKIVSTLVVIAMMASTLVVLNHMTDIKIVPASATPGVGQWGSGVSSYNYAPTTRVLVKINTTVLNPSTTYYLYKPSYNLSTTGSIVGAGGLYWGNNKVYTVNPDGTSGPVAYITTAADPINKEVTFNGYVYLDRAGMWLVDNDNDHSSFGTYIWVNTTTALTISGVSDFNYGLNATKTVSVKEGSNLAYAYVDLIDPHGLTVRHDWQTGEDTWGIIGNITMAGNYTLRAYKDINGTSTSWDEYNDELVDPTYSAFSGYGSDNFTGYYGQNFSSGLITYLSSVGDYYSYSTCGPWNPPEKNATELKFKVKPGTLSLEIPAGNKTVYYNFPGGINVSVKNSNDDAMVAADYTVEVFNPANKDITSTLNITKYKGYCYIDANKWGFDSSSENGTYRIYIWSDLNSDRTESNKKWNEEWNGTTTFRVQKAPSMQFKWVDDDGSLSTNDNDGVMPYIPNVVDTPIYVQFQIIDNGSRYFGSGAPGTDYYIDNAKENITISGNSLYTGTLDKIPDVSFDFISNAWVVPIIPTMSVGGGLITIKATWKDRGIITQTLSIGGTKYWTNGSVVTVTPSSFNIGDNQTLEVKVTDAKGNPNPWANVYLFYIDDYGVPMCGTYNSGTKSFTKEINKQLGGGTSDGKYYLTFNTTMQKTNQTGTANGHADLSGIKAPRNLTIYVDAFNAGYGYAKLKMMPKGGLSLTIFPETYLAGYPYENFYINTTLVNATGGNSGQLPKDESQLAIKIYNVTGADVTNKLGTRYSDFASQISKDFTVSLSDFVFTEPGTYTVYANNNTYDSTGYNATFEVKQATVTCDKEFFVWNSDNNISATFTINGTEIATGSPLLGELVIDNISWCSDGSYNQTFVNTSYDGSSFNPGDIGLTITPDDGLKVTSNGTTSYVTVNDITANMLPVNSSMENITYWFKPYRADGNQGEWARALGRTPVQVPVVIPDTEYISLGETTTVTLTAYGRSNNPISDVYIGLSGHGIDIASTNGTTGSDGTIQFSLYPQSTGAIDIHVGNESRIIDKKINVTSWALDLTLSAVQVNEGDTFTVTAKKATTGEAIEGAKITIPGIGTVSTDATGIAQFSAPSVTSDSVYTVTAYKPGYKSPDNVQIKVLNVPKIFITAPTSAAKDASFTIKAGADDGNNNGITLTIKDSAGVVKFTGTTVNGEVSTKIGTEATYTITATKTGYTDATPVDIKITAPSPGFELITLIIAIGVALILLRRRRK